MKLGSHQLRRFKKKMDYKEVGGAPLLGINGCVIKAHGSSDAKAIKNAIGQAIKFTETGVADKISAALSKMKESKEQ